MFSTGSVGSGRTSGSEPDDSTQYECDSEGTSATTNSELSVGERREQLRKKVTIQKTSSGVSPYTQREAAQPRFKTLREATRVALGLVLDHFYKFRGGYKLSPAELRRNATVEQQQQQQQQLQQSILNHASSMTNGASSNNGNKGSAEKINTGPSATGSATAPVPPSQYTLKLSPEVVFQQRRKRLLALLGEGDDDVENEGSSSSGMAMKDSHTAPHPTLSSKDESDANTNISLSSQRHQRRHHQPSSASSRQMSKKKRVKYLKQLPLSSSISEGPPFTVQRLAEVLVSPERYYTQTHKLCNCLEKLLLVTSSSTAFGGHTGGDTSQSRREARELAALANEKERERRLRRRMSSVSSVDDLDDKESNQGRPNSASSSEMPPFSENPKKSPSENLVTSKNTDDAENSAHAREFLEAAARASLRSKFDHVAIDPHAASAAAERVGRASSPPPPSLNMSASPQNIALQAHGTGSFVRQHLQDQPGGSVVGESYSDALAHHHLLARSPSPILFSGPDSAMHLLQMHHAAALAGMPLSGNPLDVVIDPDAASASSNAGGASGTAAGGAGGPMPEGSAAAAAASGEDGDPEADPGRSSASNSDVDSESDDVSLDDSASDRSDGSDTGSLKDAPYEPFTAARVMALNRMQQQQRSQSRALNPALPSTGSHLGDGFRPPADSEYQSGDSVDSMVAEDSGGSDSSSSDLAD